MGIAWGRGSRAAGLALALAAGAWPQTSWQTTHTSDGGWNAGNCELMSAAVRVTVHPAWLDVEEDLEIASVGAVSQGNDPKSLEITGLFRLPAAAAITGALLWDGDKVLQAKLLDKAKADSLYESMVERNSLPPPRPRDPILLDMLGAGSYRVRIYPAELSRSRHFRLRYQLPPVIGTDGLEMGLQAAVASLFPAAQSAITVTFQGATADPVILALRDGSRATLELPRTRLMKASDLAGPFNPGYWGYDPGTRLIPVDRKRQVAVRTSIASGSMAGHYLNLYAGVDDGVLAGLGRKVEVVVLWKWHAPALWALENQYGYADYGYIYQAQGQAQSLLGLYGQMGGMGNKIGLLHDDGKGERKKFPVSSRNEEGYRAALEYLERVQGNYAAEFALGLKPAVRPKPGDAKAAVRASQTRFFENLRMVKSLYSPSTGVVRHLLLVSAGPENASSDTEANAYFDSLFREEPVSVGILNGVAFSQAGFDEGLARGAHPVSRPLISTPYATLPGFEALNLNVVVRNEGKAYDFPIRCEGGLDLACGNLTFHGKSDKAWKDSLEWEAFDAEGKLIGKAKTLPARIGGSEDTSIAVLWAGSESPFSENRKEPPLGPVYGFVDRWASLVGLPKDSLKDPDAFADTGVPRVSPARLADVIPDYRPGDAPDGGSIGVIARQGGLGRPDRWKLERVQGGFILRIPGLDGGLEARVELYDVSGKAAGAWSLRSEAGALRIAAAGPRPGVYMLKVRVGGTAVSKRIAL